MRGVLEQSAGYQELDDEKRRSLANAMVKVSALAAHLIGEEASAQRELEVSSPTAPVIRRPPMARAQDAPAFGTAAQRVASTTRDVLNAVSFPRFVTDLINGVFRAMLDSSAQQMQMYVDLLKNVSASLDGFANTQFSLDQARRWLTEQFPGRFEYEAPDEGFGDEEPIDPEDVQPSRIRLSSGASMPGPEELRMVFGMGPEESIDASNPEQLVPFARRQIARQRQQMLATMIMMGMQRIVVESGQIHASMRFHVDTRSAATSEQGSQFNLQNRVRASGSFGVGPWGASAEIENTIGYVSTQSSRNTEEMNTDLELNSSVDLVFRSDYIPLNRMAAQAHADHIRANTLNPAVEMARAASEERQQRQAGQRESETLRARSVGDRLSQPSTGGAPAGPTPAQTAPATPAPSSGESPTPAPTARSETAVPVVRSGGATATPTPTIAPAVRTSTPVPAPTS